MGRGVRAGGPPAGRDPRPRRTTRDRVLSRQPDRSQPRHDPLRPVLREDAGHAQQVLCDLARPAASHAGLAGDVRTPSAPAGPRRRPHALLPNVRCQPGHLQRQLDDGTGDRAADEGDPRARGRDRGRRSAPHRDRRSGHRARVHTPGHRRPPHGGDDPHHPRGARSPPGTPRELHRRRRAPPDRHRAVLARARRLLRSDRRRKDPGPRAPLSRRRAGHRVRPRRRLHAGVRRSVRLADQRAQRHHRQPRSGRSDPCSPNRRSTRWRWRARSA